MLPEARAGAWSGFAGGFWASDRDPERIGLCLWPSMHRHFRILGPTLSLSGGHCCHFTASRARLRAKWQRAGEGTGNDLSSYPSGSYSLELDPSYCRLLENLHEGSSRWAGLQSEKIKWAFESRELLEPGGGRWCAYLFNRELVLGTKP